MWCLNNLDSFQLTDKEQELYDAVAIAIIDSSFIETPFLKEDLAIHVKDKNALENRETPICIMTDFTVMCNKQSPIYKRVIDELGCYQYPTSNWGVETIEALFHEKQKVDDFFVNQGVDDRVDYEDF